MRSAIQAAASLSLLLSFPPSQEPPVFKVDRQVYLMGTLASFEIYAPDRQTGLDRIETLIGLLEETERELSTWQTGSILSRLSRHPVGLPFLLDPAQCNLFRELKVWHTETGRAFDPAIGALIRAWGLRETPRRPSPAALRSAMIQSGLDYLRIDSNCTAVRRRDIIFDAGGFGKGEALDRIRAYSLEQGIQDWMVDLGGQIMVDGIPRDGTSWDVALAHPVERNNPALRISLAEGSIATSGGSERDVSAGVERLGHILDPRTGHPVSRRASVSVWHPRGLIADILSTALYVMGVEEGLSWAEKNRIAACFLVPAGNEVEVRASSLFKERFIGP